ncbi:MAG: thioredoxin family protein [Acidisphaera sp.]|nr:thioredoxin family protein [Acidisphaera sp.]
MLLLCAAGMKPASAMESAPVSSERAVATLVSDTDAVAPGQPFRVGLRLRLAPGWHTYWIDPGDAGAAPELSFTLPQGVSAGGIVWPTPERLPEGPLMSYALTGDVLLPVTVSPGTGSADAIGAGGLPIEAHASWLVCAKICVPEEGTFHLLIAAGKPSPSPQTGLFAAAEARTPRASPWPAHFAADGTLSIAGDGLSPARIASAWFFPASAGAIDPAAPQSVAIEAGSVRLALHPGPAFDRHAPLSGVLVLRDTKGETSALQISATPAAMPQEPVGLGLLHLLGLALLGGLILNLMPCVFPVLAIKALALARLSGGPRREIRLHALSYTAGVLVTFVGLGEVLLGLRAAGRAAGWGFQFQSPVFVAAMAWLLFAVGLILSGVFQLGSRLTGTGQVLASRQGHAGSFFTGLLAVLVATPCTAPFMGAAVAAAVAASAPVTLAIFLAMGLGLAMPYALLALAPVLAGALPRPGRWMDVLKQGLAFPMYAATVWLVWVISQEAGPDGVLGTAAGLLLIGFAAWALGAAQQASVQGRRLGRAAALCAVLAALAVLPGIAIAPGPGQPQDDAMAEPFSQTRLDALRAAGKPVFVNVTAAWCVTCLVNEHVALAPQAVREAFVARHVVYLKGDWTRQDPELTAFLRRHGSEGVPLYLFYPAGNAPPAVLPQILTESTMLDQLSLAGT